MTLSPQEISERYDLPIEAAQLALNNLQNGIAFFVTVSGKIGAGKDTVAPLLLDLMEIPETERKQDSFARTLKEEIDQVIQIVISSEKPEDAAQLTAVTQGVSLEKARVTVNYIWDEITANNELTAYSRTAGVRSALQFWGTEVRREQDDNYWVNKTIHRVLLEACKGVSSYITDSRFPNEAAAVRDAGGLTIRLLVSPEEQERRIKARDGLQISAEARAHVSETALDDYDNFHIVVDTDELDAKAVAAIIKEEIVFNGF